MISFVSRIGVFLNTFTPSSLRPTLRVVSVVSMSFPMISLLDRILSTRLLVEARGSSSSVTPPASDHPFPTRYSTSGFILSPSTMVSSVTDHKILVFAKVISSTEFGFPIREQVFPRASFSVQRVSVSRVFGYATLAICV